MNLANNSSTKKTSSTTGSATTDSPYLGSKISLVSKAKIRYEGILYTIDANESTVALSKVRSFGTEDRPTDRPVPARDEIFEYIIFRGADIEDLQVREPPQTSLTQDPAIVESSAYPDNARSTTIGTNTNLSGLAGNGPNRSLSNRGTMPSPPMQQGQSNKGYNNNKSSDPLRQFHFNQQRSNRSYNYPSPMNPYEGNARRYRPSQQQDYYPMNRRNSAYPAEWNRPSQRFSRAVPIYENNRFYPSRRNQGQRERRNSTGGMNTSSHRNNNRQQHQHQHQQQQQQHQQQQGERTRSNGTSARSTLKFVGDFDFEKSNAEFDKNAIEDELKKSLSLKSTTKKSDETSNDQEQEKEKDKENQDQNQSEHQQDQQQQQQTSPLDSFYDKQKSFFDCISCEASEKEKTSNRRNWNEERRVNAETFGLKYRPFQQNNGGNQRPGNRRNNGGRYQRANYSGRNAGYYGSFSNRVRAY